MSVAIEQVKYWYTNSGVSHVVAEVVYGWSLTICNMAVTGDPEEKPEIPKRICRKCRKALERCELIESSR